MGKMNDYAIGLDDDNKSDIVIWSAPETELPEIDFSDNVTLDELIQDSKNDRNN